jgi:hypothetical protein
VDFKILGEIRGVETIAAGRRIRIIDRLNREFGRGNWRKLKGLALVRLSSGRVVEAELHWYEAHGIGKRKLKIKRYLRR